MFKKNRFAFFCLSVIVMLSSAVHARTITARQRLGNGYAFSWVDFNAQKKPTAIGISLTAAALTGLGNEELEVVLQPKKKWRIPPFEHMGLNWNPHGHEPEAIYGAQHFDFHFYTILLNKRLNITCAGKDAEACMRRPDPKTIPADYAPTPEGVPLMGWHWVDLKSPEFNGQPFTATLIYGFYEGKLDFIEPMITLDFLKSLPNVSYLVKQPEVVAKKGYYPQKYSIIYNPVNDLFDIFFNELVYRTVH